MKKVSAIVFRQFGNPAEVLEVEDQDSRVPGPLEAVVRMLAAPVNPADLNMIEGKYPVRPELPAVPGMEGVGEVIALGPGVEEPPVGVRVLIPHGVGTWREECIVRADSLIEVPEALEIEQAAMLMINPPTAWRMLHDFEKLEPEDWVVQNAANSGVGRCVIKICRSLRVRTINLVRREELISELEAEGGDVVLLDGEEVAEEAKRRAAGGAIKLGLNAVGGESAVHVSNALSRSGTVVTFGAMGRKPLKIPNGLLIFKDLKFRGFWITKWFQDSTAMEKAAMFGPLIDLARRGELNVKIAATYKITEVKRAIEHAASEARGGKVLFRF